jgi:hypothetical protein
MVEENVTESGPPILGDPKPHRDNNPEQVDEVAAMRKRKAGKPKAAKPKHTSLPDEPLTKSEMWCRPCGKFHQRAEFGKSFIKRRDFRCKAAFKKAYGEKRYGQRAVLSASCGWLPDLGRSSPRNSSADRSSAYAQPA